MTDGQPAAKGTGLGLFLISVTILALEVLHVRILSVQMWYHHAYIIVTMAMLGFAVAGTLVTVRPSLLTGDVQGRLARYSVIFGVLIIAAHFAVPLTADSVTQMSSTSNNLALALTYCILFIPYLFGGMVTTIALSSAQKVHKLYFVNLVGSALGAWAFIGLITPLGGERLLALCAAGALLSGLAFLRPSTHPRTTGAAVLGLVAAGVFMVWPDPLHTEVGSGKRKFTVGESVYERWTPLSRLDVVEDPENPAVVHILQDGVAGTLMHSDEHWKMRAPLGTHYIAYIPFLRQKLSPEVLVIGLGGGSDLRAAVEFGASSVLGVEINPAMVQLTGEDFADYNGGIYKKPGVSVEVGEGRSTLRRLDRKFDIIQLAGVDTYTSGAAGAFVLSESYLYTMEAISDYFDHLNPEGKLGIVRFHDEPPRETLRIFGMALLELRRRGVEQPSRHAVVIRDQWVSGTVFSPTPMLDEDIALYATSNDSPGDGHDALYLPGRADTNKPVYEALARAIDDGTEDEFYAAHPIDIRPVTDDSPFFFNFHHFWDFVDQEDSAFAREFGIVFTVAPSILRTVLIQTSILVLLLVLAPLFWLKRDQLRTAHVGRHLLFFLSVGAAFMFLEISMIQRLVLFLGHPTYSLTVVLFCFLFFAGLGSLWSGRFVRDPVRGVRRAVIGLCAVSIVYLIVLGPILSALLDLSLTGRVLVTIGLLAPLNFLMGMPFPLALTRLKSTDPQLVPWAIGANGGASVIGSVLAVVIAMETGFATVMVVSLAVYFIGMLATTTGPLATSSASAS